MNVRKLQRVANHHVPEDWVYVSDLENIVRKRVWETIEKGHVELPPLADFNAPWEPSWYLKDQYSPEEMATMPAIIQIRRRQERRNKSLIDGIVSILIDSFFLPDNKAISKKPEVAVFKDGVVSLCEEREKEALFWIADPDGTPKICRTSDDVPALLNYDHKVRHHRVFIEHETWGVLPEPRMYLAATDAEADDFADAWKRLHGLSGGYLIFRTHASEKRKFSRDKNDVKGSAIKEIMNTFRESTSRKIPTKGTTNFDDLVKEGVNFYRSLSPQDREGLTKRTFAQRFKLGGDPSKRNRKMDILWKEVCANLPETEANALRKPGRRRSINLKRTDN